MGRVIGGVAEPDVWKFYAVLPRAGRRLATAGWVLLLLAGALPAALVVAMGALVRAVAQAAPSEARSRRWASSS